MLTEQERTELEERVDVAMYHGGFSPPRIGQAYMNCLADVNNDVYRKIVAEETADCFYVDTKVPVFLAYIGIDPEILLAAEKFGFNVSFEDHTPQWVIRHEELFCVLFWSSLSSIPSFWEATRNYFEEVGAEKLAYSVLT